MPHCYSADYRWLGWVISPTIRLTYVALLIKPHPIKTYDRLPLRARDKLGIKFMTLNKLYQNDPRPLVKLSVPLHVPLKRTTRIPKRRAECIVWIMQYLHRVRHEFFTASRTSVATVKFFTIAQTLINVD